MVTVLNINVNIGKVIIEEINVHRGVCESGCTRLNCLISSKSNTFSHQQPL